MVIRIEFLEKYKEASKDFTNRVSSDAEEKFDSIFCNLEYIRDITVDFIRFYQEFEGEICELRKEIEILKTENDKLKKKGSI